MGKTDAVKCKRFSVEQIVAVLKQAEMGVSVADLIRHLGIAEQTFYRGRQGDTGLHARGICQGRRGESAPRAPHHRWKLSVAMARSWGTEHYRRERTEPMA